jgi:phosphotransferase system enzyme I (PtsI)
MTARALPDVATALASVTFSQCQKLAQLALGAESGQEARSLVRSQLAVLDEPGL